MLPIQHKHIVRSRWVALLWAGGILWFAYDFASSDRANDDNSAANDAQVEQALNAF